MHQHVVRRHSHYGRELVLIGYTVKRVALIEGAEAAEGDGAMGD